MVGEIGFEEAVPAVIESLQHHDSKLPGPAIEALGKIGSTEAVSALLRVMKEDEYAFVRSYAIRELGRIGCTDTVSSLIQTMEADESDSVRGKAAKTLGTRTTSSSQ